MKWANMRTDATRRATPRPMCPGSLNRCVLKNRAAARYGLTVNVQPNANKGWDRLSLAAIR